MCSPWQFQSEAVVEAHQGAEGHQDASDLEAVRPTSVCVVGVGAGAVEVVVPALSV